MVADPVGEYDDVVELINLTNDTIYMLGYYLSDNPNNPTKWPFPDTFIAPNAFLVVWCDNQMNQPGLHTNFGLSASGESVVLTNRFLTQEDRIDFPEQSQNVSYGRYPDGTGPWRYMYPTIGYGNLKVNVENEMAKNKLSIFPNPTSGIIQFNYPQEQFFIYDKLQRLVFQHQGQTLHQINLSHLPKGVYWLKFESITQKIILQ